MTSNVFNEKFRGSGKSQKKKWSGLPTIQCDYSEDLKLKTKLKSKAFDQKRDHIKLFGGIPVAFIPTVP